MVEVQAGSRRWGRPPGCGRGSGVPCILPQGPFPPEPWTPAHSGSFQTCPTAPDPALTGGGAQSHMWRPELWLCLGTCVHAEGPHAAPRRGKNTLWASGPVWRSLCGRPGAPSALGGHAGPALPPHRKLQPRQTVPRGPSAVLCCTAKPARAAPLWPGLRLGSRARQLYSDRALLWAVAESHGFVILLPPHETLGVRADPDPIF